LLHATFAVVSGFGTTTTPGNNSPSPMNEAISSFINMEFLSKK
jgi:hypothetical protein